MPLNELIRAKRKELGLTQQNLADSIGVTAVAFTNWEHGLRKPTIPNRIKLAKAFGMDPLALVPELQS